MSSCNSSCNSSSNTISYETEVLPVTLSRDIDDMVTSIQRAGFSADLYEPDLPPEEGEVDAYKAPFLPQLLAGLQIFARLFCTLDNKAWAHLTAEMQAGKTGVVCVVLRLILQNLKLKLLPVLPSGVFLITGMSDNAWVKQTRERVPKLFHDNVQHNGNLHRVKTKLHLMAKGEYLKNCLVVLDESHFASNCANRPSKEVFKTMRELCPIELWAKNNVRLITISATDPALTLAIADAKHIARDFKLMTTPEYQSVESLNSEGRLLESFPIKDDTSLRQMLAVLESKFGSEPLYHILRPQVKKNAYVQDALKSLCPDAEVMPWDSSATSKRSNTGETSSTAGIEDINEILSVKPAKRTFIVIKDMFYASKTLNDAHVGIMYDRCGAKDDTNLQSLLGRACGYGKSRRTIIFTSVSETVENYLKYWLPLRAETRIGGKVAEDLDRRMAGVVAKGDALGISSTRAIPIAMGGGGSSAAAPAPKRKVVQEDDFLSVWSPWFNTEEDCIHWWKYAGDGRKGGHGQKLKKNEAGFYVCTTTKSPCVQTKADIENLRSGKKTANMPSASSMEVGEESYRRYVAYENTNNITTARFCVHWIRKIK